jgi:site-specific DNA-methyltransferase (adenine-specific)
MAEPYQVMPDLSESEYESLKSSIAERGILVPIEVDEKGTVLDGHHRIRAWKELREAGLKVGDYPSTIRLGLSETEKQLHAYSLNYLRRQLTKEQRDGVIVKMRGLGMSYDAIAEATGVPKTTVRRKSVGPFGPTEVTGKDGKTYKAHKPKPSAQTKTRAETAKVVEAVEGLPVEELPDHTIDAKRATRLAREYSAKEKAKLIDGDHVSGGVELWLGDFRERGKDIPDESVDLIFTDPPYNAESLPLWNDLSELANRILKPNGMLVTYSGAFYLPEVMANLGRRLNYWWCGAVVLDGAHSRVTLRNVSVGSKPMLFYVRSGFLGTTWYEDTRQSDTKEKEHHDWQQGIAPALYYIKTLCPSDGLVVDPFLGGGTTALAAKQLGRRCIGIEIDPIAFAQAQERIDG